MPVAIIFVFDVVILGPQLVIGNQFLLGFVADKIGVLSGWESTTLHITNIITNRVDSIVQWTVQVLCQVSEL